MFVPFFSSSSSTSGEGEGEGSSGSSTPISIEGSSKSAATYSDGGGEVKTIGSGQPFAGRVEGGGIRDMALGTQEYGSGYPGIFGRGVSGRGFPFYFWPISWGDGSGYSANASYLYDDSEYGQPDNTSRPGGPMAFASFQSGSSNTTFWLVADNTSVAALMPVVAGNCSFSLDQSSINASAPQVFNQNTTKPEQVLRYYRASSAALAGIATTLLDCLDTTIGRAVPLVDGAMSVHALPYSSTLLLLILLRTLL
ncbi:hypothetical protein B0H16DRAFT_1664614 [Mycena metata]|uniref:Uncharacterized protein n=1 Tax=Mycena metata TaxID=1033252 RepID=A0AAD7MZG4_9AGAR|nr:hypothetical protein B0H16DRAFT_1664614 [Mycena metata]